MFKQQDVSETEFLSFEQSCANLQQCERCEIMEQHINQLKTEIDVLTEELVSKNQNQLENSFHSLQQDMYELKQQVNKQINDEQQLLNKIEYLSAENQILKIKLSGSTKRQLGYAKIKSISIKPQKSFQKIFEPFQPVNVSDLRQSMRQIDNIIDRGIKRQKSMKNRVRKKVQQMQSNIISNNNHSNFIQNLIIQRIYYIYQLMQSAPSSPNKKKSFFDSIKQFFNETPNLDDFAMINEATVNVPPSNKNSKKQVNYQFIMIKIQQEVNQTMPVQQNKFEIDNDDKEQLSEDVFDVEDKQKIKEQESVELKGYKILDVKKIENQNELQPIEGYNKHQIIEFPPQSTFKITKITKKPQNILDYFRNQVDRYLAIDGGWLYIMEKKKQDKFKVKSVTGLNRLEKVLIKENEVKPHLRLIFRDKKVKLFTLKNKEQEQMFYIKLKNELQKHKLDL